LTHKAKELQKSPEAAQSGQSSQLVYWRLPERGAAKLVVALHSASFDGSRSWYCLLSVIGHPCAQRQSWPGGAISFILRRITFDEKHAPAAPVQRFVGLRL